MTKPDIPGTPMTHDVFGDALMTKDQAEQELERRRRDEPTHDHALIETAEDSPWRFVVLTSYPEFTAEILRSVTN